jgi:AGZA family xanthine/uracil permease-like MFS transporter
MIHWIDRYFNISGQGSSVKTECVAGLTTFMTMAYIIFVNPAMLSAAGMDFGSVMMATCISAALASILMGLYANYPIALATGMGENAFFTYTIVIGMGIPWRVALGCVFVTGLLFLLLSLTRFRELLIDAIPASLKYAISGGIGLFIAFIGLSDAGLVQAHPGTMVALGPVTQPPVLLALAGLAVTAVLLVRGVSGALLWGILITAIAGIPLGIVSWKGIAAAPPSLLPTLLQMDIPAALSPALLPVIATFLFMGVFDTVGTLAGVGEMGGFMKEGKLPRSGRAFITDAVGTCVGAATGTPTVTCYIESASGIAVGGRTGLASVVTGILFLCAVFFSPVVSMIGGGVQLSGGALLRPITAPALIIVGCLMLKAVVRIPWDDFSEALPAFLILLMIPLTFSIATGIAAGFLAYVAIKLLSGKASDVSRLLYAVAGILACWFILRCVR